MTESYLQYIWANRRVPAQKLKLSDKRPVTIHDVGSHNTQFGGPDFWFGSITIDGIRLYGNIEIHVKASDWYRHKHELDLNYNNVILHVVYENDCAVIQNGVVIPTIELQSHIDTEHHENFINERIQCKDFPCQNLMHEIDSMYLASMKTKAIYQKLGSKTTVIDQSGLKEESAILYHLVALAFGTAINKPAFAQLLERVPYESLVAIPEHQRYNLIMSESGIIQSRGAQQKRLWHFKGTRPSNFPTIRVQQFAFMSARFDFELTLLNVSPSERLKVFEEMVNKLWTTDTIVPKLSVGFMQHLSINALVPYLWYLGEKRESERIQSEALELLRLIPSEKNAILNRWKKIGVQSKNAYDSQSLLAMYRYFCCHKKCLSCEVGNKILNP
ncbi:MAG: DUF2851 family protein [Crocinitomicaceae bacterium]|nr:DUF2851 family protein [Crocinitomicaceae bacterium]